ncbi:MAG: hypothetical protein RDV00_00450 [Clostridia bacterium]|nr:hypothetical protein [Clostridia bacterium]MDQ7790587.1 hypothetical protein [Clostridia bacterium]
MGEVRCPRCRSKRIEPVRKKTSALIFLVGAVVALWLAQSVQLLWAMVGVFLAMALIKFMDQDTVQCTRCKHTWEVEQPKSGRTKPDDE